MVVLFAFIAFLGWGTGNVFGGIVARKIGAFSSALWSSIFSVVITSFYIPFALNELYDLDLKTAVLLLILISLGTVPVVTFYQGVKVGNASLVGTIGKSFGALVVILSVIFLGDHLNNYQIFSIITIFIGLLLSSIDTRTLSAKQVLSDKGIPYALVSMIFWGIYYTFIVIPIKRIGWFWPTYLTYWNFLLIYIIMKIKNVDVNIPKPGKITFYSIMTAVVLAVGTFAYNFAVSKGQTAIVAPIAGANPILFAVLGYIIFKDRLTKQQLLGIGTTLLGIISLSLI